MTKDNSTEILGPEERSHSVAVDGLPQSALRAIIAKLNERSQRATRNFNKLYDLQVSDIKQIMEKLRQEFSGRKIINISATVSLFLSKGQRYDFRTWEEFADFDTSLKETTRSISLEVTIDVLDGDNSTPERYQCQVSVQNNPRELGFVIGPLAISSVEHAGLPPTPIAASVTYNNYIVGKNLLAAIDDWEATLRVRENSFWRRMKRRSSAINGSMVFAGSIAGILFAYNFLPSFVAENDWRAWATYMAIIVAVFWKMASISGDFAEQYIDRRQEPANILITSGDQRAEDRRSKKNRGHLQKVLLAIAVVVSQIVLAVLAEPIIQLVWGS